METRWLSWNRLGNMFIRITAVGACAREARNGRAARLQKSGKHSRMRGESLRSQVAEYIFIAKMVWSGNVKCMSSPFEEKRHEG